MKTGVKILTAAVLSLFQASYTRAANEPAPDGAAVQLALLIDTSNSMDGLIAQAKTQLWSIVNEFAEAKRAGNGVHVEVALYEYGNNTIPAAVQHVRQIHGFTRDLDAVSDALFKLKTNGGEEYCGAATLRAVEDLRWSSHAGTYKAIFIAGNEPYTQGPVDAEKSSLLAMRQGVVVNTIHCGDATTGRSTGWSKGAELASGKSFAIDQNHVSAVVDAPQDAELVKLNAELNTTYLAYGQIGLAASQNQMLQDSNAGTSNAARASRILCKSTTNYWNDSWDLVDAIKANKAWKEH